MVIGNQVFPALWIGTSVGNVALITLNIPPTGEQRYIQPVMALVTGEILFIQLIVSYAFMFFIVQVFFCKNYSSWMRGSPIIPAKKKFF